MEDKFIMLSHSFIRDKNTTIQEKIVLMEILNLSSLDAGCFASNSHFEKSFGISKKSVSNTISSLVKKGLITSELSNRNHKRLLSIKSGGLSIKSGGLSIKSGESKDNKTINKTINNNYDNFIKDLKAECPYKTKITKTKSGYTLFNSIKDIDQLKDDYIKHQINKKEFAVRITAFMEDYETVYKQATQPSKTIHYDTSGNPIIGNFQ